MSRVLRIADVCRELGRSPDCIRDWVRREILPATRSPSGQLQFDPHDVQAVKRGDLAPQMEEPAPRQAEPSEGQPTEAQPRQTRHPTWDEMAPWDRDVEQARASVEIERLNTDLEGVRAERERVQQAAARASNQENAAAAERERLAKLKQHAKTYSWIPSEIEPQATAEIERFVTSEQVPSWLQTHEQTEIVMGHVRRFVQAWSSECTSKLIADMSDRVEKSRRDRDAARQRTEEETRQREIEKRKQAEIEQARATENRRTAERAKRRAEREGMGP
jgi:hypothetical protein